jgi:hypothetical protein
MSEKSGGNLLFELDVTRAPCTERAKLVEDSRPPAILKEDIRKIRSLLGGGQKHVRNKRTSQNVF